MIRSMLTAAALAGSLVISLAGCASDPTQGYAFESAHDSAIRTVSVSIFQNPTYFHGVELELTDAVIKQIQAATPWRVTSESDAQTTLTGTIKDVQLRRLTIAGEIGYVQEMDYTITVDFTWKDARTGKILAARRAFTASDTFAPARRVGERIEAGQHGAVQRLARDLVAELRSNW